MRIAIISDIHSNLEALTKAFELIDKESIKEVVCLGDIVGYGANPNECVRLVRDRCKIVLLGNHDAAALDPERADDFNRNAREAALWTNKKLSAESKKMLGKLPMQAEMEDLLFVHSSPCDPEDWNYIILDHEAHQAFECFSEKICFVGHTHAPVVFSEMGRTKTMTGDGRYLINVGSVGQPRDGNPSLSFGILDSTTWNYRNIRSKYDIEAAAAKIRNAGLPAPLADRLFMGV
ncbi:MAG: metallophosphoesterase family protein [Bacteroidota bacterium]